MVAEKIFQNQMANLRSSEKTQKKIMTILHGCHQHPQGCFFLRIKISIDINIVYIPFTMSHNLALKSLTNPVAYTESL